MRALIKKNTYSLGPQLISVSDTRSCGGHQKIFDQLSYKPWYPNIIDVNEVVVTRIGQCFARSVPLTETMYSNPYVFSRSLAVAGASLLRRGVSRVSGELGSVAVIHTAWSAGFYHWMTEAVPRALVCLDNVPDVTFLLPNDPRYAKFAESLSFIGAGNVEYFPEGRNVIVENALLTTVPRRFGTVAPVLLNRVREAFLQKLNSRDPQLAGKRRIYVTRKLARGRRVANESEVVRLLEQFGFEVVAFEEHSLAEQVAMMSEAEALVTIHGAALTNMMFMPENGAVLELLPEKQGIWDFNIVRMSLKHDPCYVRMASAMGLRHFAMQCQPVDCRHRSTHMADIFVDLVELESAVKAMLELD